MACEDGQEGAQALRSQEGRAWCRVEEVSSSCLYWRLAKLLRTLQGQRSGGTTGHTYFHILPDKNQNNFLLLGYAI